MDILILCAGNGKRMNSSIPKVLHLFHHKEFIIHILEKCQSLSFHKIYIIIQSKFLSLFQSKLSNYTIQYIFQDEPLGTGHALQCFMNQEKIHNDNLLILNGDMPNLNINIINKFILSKSNIIVSHLKNPKGYGRIKKKNHQIKIIEDKDNNEINHLCNLGIYYFSIEFIKENINKLTNFNLQNEYYITQLFDFLNPCQLFEIDEMNQKYFLGVNTIQELYDLEKMI